MMTTPIMRGAELGPGPHLSGSPFAMYSTENANNLSSSLMMEVPPRAPKGLFSSLHRKSSLVASLRRLSSALGLGKNKKAKDLDARSVSQHQPTQVRSVHGGSDRLGSRSPASELLSTRGLHSASTGTALSRQATNLTNSSPVSTFSDQRQASSKLAGITAANPPGGLATALLASQLPNSPTNSSHQRLPNQQDCSGAQQIPSSPSPGAPLPYSSRLAPSISDNMLQIPTARLLQNGTGLPTAIPDEQLAKCLSAPSEVADTLCTTAVMPEVWPQTPDTDGGCLGAIPAPADSSQRSHSKAATTIPASATATATAPALATAASIAAQTPPPPPSQPQACGERASGPSGAADVPARAKGISVPGPQPSASETHAATLQHGSVPLPHTPPQQTQPLTDRLSPEPSNLLAISRALPPGMRRGAWSIDDYAITRRLFKGSRTAVYKAVCKFSSVPVALKVYFLSKVPGNTLHQIAREIQIHAGLSHKNILALYGAFQDSKRLVLVTELAARGDLYKLHCAMDRLTESQVRRVVLEPLLDSLAYLHARGVCHRDIKPENILFTSDWEFRLADFGVSINLTEERAVTRAGTADYMAPEVERCPLKSCPEDNKDNLSLAYTTAADVWSVGVLAYELLVGFPPVVVDADRSDMRAFSAATLSFPASVSQEGRDFITSALAPHSEDRPTVRQLRNHPWLLGGAGPSAAAAAAAAGSGAGSGGSSNATAATHVDAGFAL